MALRWTAAGMLEAEKQFRRIIGYRDLAKLAVAIERDQIPIGQRVLAAVEDSVEAGPVGELELKGFGRPVVAYEVRGVESAS